MITNASVIKIGDKKGVMVHLKNGKTCFTHHSVGTLSCLSGIWSVIVDICGEKSVASIGG